MKTRSIETETPVSTIVGRQHVLAGLANSSSTPARLVRVAIVILGLIVGLNALRSTFVGLQAPFIYRKDFAQDYLFAKALLRGLDPYVPLPLLAQDLVADAVPVLIPHPNPHPPVAGFLALPFALFDYPFAATAWLVFELLCLVLAVHLLALAVRRRISPVTTLFLAGCALGWYPFYGELLNGQFTIVLLLLHAGAWLALRANRNPMAGLLLGLGLLIKPVGWPVALLFVFGRDWRAFVATGATVLGGHLFAAAVIGFGGLFRYYAEVLPEVARLYRVASWNASLGTIGWRLFADRASAAIDATDLPWVPITPLVELPVAAAILSVALPAVAVAIAVVQVRRRPDVDRSFAALICVSLLVSPTVWSYYLVLAVIPATWVVDRLARNQFPSSQVNAALLVALLLAVPHQALARVVPFAHTWLPLTSAVAVGALWRLVVALPERPATAAGERAAPARADPATV